MLAQFISGSQRIFEGGISLTDAGRRFARARTRCPRDCRRDAGATAPSRAPTSQKRKASFYAGL